MRRNTDIEGRVICAGEVFAFRLPFFSVLGWDFTSGRERKAPKAAKPR